ncbi:MAG: NAD(P)H-binding protein [Myxococcota bacterium]
MEGPQGRLLVTGANGHLGRRLIERVLREDRAPGVEAVVRSDRAAAVLEPLRALGELRIHIVDPGDADALTSVGRGCTHAIHLIGILKQGPGTRYADAHEGTCSALARAAEKNAFRRIVYLSILGASVDSKNACLASKARAEQILLEAPVPTVVLRVPMVLGGEEPGARAIRAQARAGLVPLVRGGRSREQPIDADDVTQAILRGLSLPGLGPEILALAGPESLPRRELLERAAALTGGRPRVVALPLWLAWLFAGASELVLASPPLTRAMLGVLEQDDDVDPGQACARLELELTPLDETLRRCLVDGARQ